MKVIKDNLEKVISKPKLHTCRWCKSVCQYNDSDITTGDLLLSQQEEYKNIDGLICPVCERFDNLNNGY